MTEVALVGLGVLGRAMARRLLDTGARVRGYDVSAEARDALGAAGGTPAGSVGEAAGGAGVLVVVVHDERQVDDVLFEQGAATALRPGAVVWLASTVSPAFARALSARLVERGPLLVDGPVSGGIPRALAGELSVFAGATEEALASARPTIERCAARVFPTGEAGTGSAMKLINQILTGANIALTAEALLLGRSAGIAPETLIEAVSSSAGTSRQFELRAPRMASGDHELQASVGTFLKDLTIAVAAAAELDAAAPMAEAARRVFEAAGRMGYLDDSDTRLLDAYERGLGGRAA